jgi:hypothetical protein
MLAELIKVSTLIIWDVAPMTHRHCFEALDRTLRDIRCEEQPGNTIIPFGGKLAILGGKPVMRKGSRSAIVNASITGSKLWQHVSVLKLRVNMRLYDPSLPHNELILNSLLRGSYLLVMERFLPKEKERSMSLHGLPFLRTC